MTATGVELAPPMAPLPSCAEALFPHARTWPVEVKARLCVKPAEIAVAIVHAGWVTLTGVLLSTVVPFPSCPLRFRPQDSTEPVVVRARLWSWPPARAVMVVPAARLTRTGLLLLVVVPFPS